MTIKNYFDFEQFQNLNSSGINLIIRIIIEFIQLFEIFSGLINLRNFKNLIVKLINFFVNSIILRLIMNLPIQIISIIFLIFVKFTSILIFRILKFYLLLPQFLIFLNHDQFLQVH